MQVPSIPELEVLAVQVAVFILLLFALAGLVVKEYYRLKGRWVKGTQPSAQHTKSSRAVNSPHHRATMLQMPTDHILSLLISERDKLTRAIEVLEGSSRGGRPRKNAMPATDAEPTPNYTARKRPRWTAAMRRAASERGRVAYAERMKKAGKKR